MSITNNRHEATFANYSWNTMNATNAPPNDTDATVLDPNLWEEVAPTYTFEYQHHFIDHCYLLSDLRWFKLAKGITYGLFLTIWIAFVWYVWGNT